MPDQFTDRLGQTLRRIRDEKRLTREDVAQHIGKTPRHLAAIELGQRCPSIDTLHDLILFYDISADRVFYPELSNDYSALERIIHLVAGCSPKQQEFIADFIELLKKQNFREE